MRRAALRRRLSHFGVGTCGFPPRLSSTRSAFRTPILVVENSGYISVFPAVAFCEFSLLFFYYLVFFSCLFFSRLAPEFISSPVQFVTRNIHSLIPARRDVTAPRWLLPPVPPLDGPVPAASRTGASRPATNT